MMGFVTTGGNVIIIIVFFFLAHFFFKKKIALLWNKRQEMVRSCGQLMEEYQVDTCPMARLRVVNEAEPETEQLSPVGVLDAAACRSCGTRSKVPSSSGQQHDEPPNKRPRLSPGEEEEDMMREELP